MDGPVELSRRLRAIGCCAVAAWSLAAAASAGATVTLGSDLAVLPDSSVSCGAPPCSLSQTELPGRTVSSPVNGTVTRWGVWLSSTGSARFRVIRPMGTGALFLSSSATEAIPHGGMPFYFPISLPIAIGDRIAQDDLGTVGVPDGVLTAGASIAGFNPPPLDGAAGAAVAATPGVALSLNALVEPTAQFTLVGTKTQAKKGTATVTATLPNPGVLGATGSHVKSASITAAAPGDVTLKLFPTKAAKKRLKKKGKSGGSVALTFMPSFGAAATRTVAVKLKLKRKRKKQRR
jgi:hypothetical protein